jgi:outer membrane protein assembly factor BamB
MRRPAFFLALTAGLALSIAPAASQEWGQFRGPRAGAAADDPALPDTWSETENVAWTIDIPGLSWSSPVVWGDHIFVLSAVSAGEEPQPIPGLYDPGEEQGSERSSAEHRWMVYNVDFESGRINWERELHRGVPPIAKHIKNTFASETPVTDGRNLFVYFGTLGLVAALDMSGETVWTREIGVFNSVTDFGMAASPALHDDRLYVVNDNTTKSFMTVLDSRTGEELWRLDRAERGQNWSTPFVWKNDLRTEIVTAGTGGVRSYDLDGSLLWEIHGMSGLTVPTPFAKFGLVYLSSGYPGGGIRPVYAVRPGAEGDISIWPTERGGFSARFPGPLKSSEHIAWSYPLLGTYSTTALVYGDYYYTLLDRGFLLNHDARTGEEIYGRQRLGIGGFTASPWAYNGKIFVLSENGDTFVVRAGREFEILHTNSLDEMSMATPAMARGSLILRTRSKLYRLTAGSQQ